MNLIVHPIINSAALNGRDDAVLSIRPPEAGKVRSRKVVTRSRARATGKYPSWKAGRMVQWESINELNAFRLLDANPAVVGFREQPLLITYRLDGGDHLHFPDVLVETKDGRELWEVKPASEAAEPDCVSRTRLLVTALPPLGFTYRIVIGEDMARKPRLKNVLTMLKFGRRPITPLERETLRRILDAAGYICWGAAKDGVFGGRGRLLLARSFLEGAVVFDVEQQLVPGTRFAPPAEPKSGV